MSGPEIIHSPPPPPPASCRWGNQGPGRENIDKLRGGSEEWGEAGELECWSQVGPQGYVYLFVLSKNIYRTPTAVNPNSSCHPWKTEAPREEMTLLRSQSKFRAESGPEPRTPAPRVSSHLTSCFSSPSGPSREISSHHGHRLS